MTQHILAGDIGGSKTLLCLYELKDKRLRVIRRRSYHSDAHPRFADLLREFLRINDAIDAACFGIAAPVLDNRCNSNDLPWSLEQQSISNSLGGIPVQLLNDLEAAAYGMLHLPTSDLLELNPAAKERHGNIAVIAADRHLGEGMLFWDGRHHHSQASEGGHCGFASNSPQQDALLMYLRDHFDDHISWERLLANTGLPLIYEFLKDVGFAPESTTLANAINAAHSDASAIICEQGLNGDDLLCSETLRLYCELYGSEAGDLALRCLPLGGVYITGDMARKIRPALESGDFLGAFAAKGRMHSLMKDIPLRLCLNAEAPLLGAAHGALRSLSQAE